MSADPAPRVSIKKALGKTVSLPCPHCHIPQQVRPDALSIFCNACHQSIDIQEELRPKKENKKTEVKTISVICSSCQSENQIRPGALSVFCKKCHQSMDIQRLLHPAHHAEIREVDTRHILCFRCRAELTPSLKAQAVMCKKCGYRNDLQDYHVKDVLSRDIETYGKLDVAAGATVLNSTAHVKSAVIHGKFIGKLSADEDIVLKPNSIFEGSIRTPSLTLESQSKLILKKEFWVEKLTIAGELYAHITTHGSIELKKGCCFAGSIRTHRIMIEDGATVVANLRIGLEGDPASDGKEEGVTTQNSGADPKG